MKRAIVLLALTSGCSAAVMAPPPAAEQERQQTPPPGQQMEMPPPQTMEMEMEMETPPPAPCAYPESDGVIRLGEVMPNVRWDAVYTADGDTRPFSLEDVFCRREQADKKLIAFIVGAGWCPNCPDYVRYVNSTAAEIEAAGGMVVYLEAQDANYEPADSRDAYTYIRRLIGTGSGLRAGDADALPSPQVFFDSPEIRAIPDAIVVRTSDMRVISTQGNSDEILDFAAMAADPEQDWSLGFLFSNRCAEGDEEESEPNNDNVLYSVSLAPGTVRGGICTPHPDYYRVRETGDWRLTLEHDDAAGDLDAVVYDPETRDALERDGKVIGATSGGNVETFTWHGPAVIEVRGVDHASAGYRLTLERL